MVQNIDLCGYKDPTPVQAYTIPAAIQNRDIISVAQTGIPLVTFRCVMLTLISGSGKTAAYLIPTISKLMGKVKKLAGRRPNLANGFNPDIDAVRAEPLILVVAPTRELCTQIFDEARRLCYRSMLRPCVAYGGAPKREQQAELQRGCDILIATPGRLLDFMSMPHVLTLGRVR
jgi:ATP-dependent RNA helicase DDX3X